MQWNKEQENFPFVRRHFLERFHCILVSYVHFIFSNYLYGIRNYAKVLMPWFTETEFIFAIIQNFIYTFYNITWTRQKYDGKGIISNKNLFPNSKQRRPFQRIIKVDLCMFLALRLWHLLSFCLISNSVSRICHRIEAIINTMYNRVLSEIFFGKYQTPNFGHKVVLIMALRLNSTVRRITCYFSCGLWLSCFMWHLT